MLAADVESCAIMFIRMYVWFLNRIFTFLVSDYSSFSSSNSSKTSRSQDSLVSWDFQGDYLKFTLALWNICSTLYCIEYLYILWLLFQSVCYLSALFFWHTWRRVYLILCNWLLLMLKCIILGWFSNAVVPAFKKTQLVYNVIFL